MDGSRRVRIDLPAAFDLDRVLGLINKHRAHFDIRVRQACGSIYVLNLDNCFKYLTNVQNMLRKSKYDLRNFIDQGLLKSDGWTQCVRECDPTREILAHLYVWGNMPSRASYSYVPKQQRYLPAGLPERLMDAEDPDERDDIILGAQLSRIMCRKLELDAYAFLQKTLNNISSLEPKETVKLVRELGLILLSLRWRVSWWALLGDGGTTSDKCKECFEYRVQGLCRVLYFYYCNMRRKLPSWTDSSSLRGVISNYADTSIPVFDDFPGVDSIEGFEDWMKRGQGLIVRAGVAPKLNRIGLNAK